jgi:hypothetical protein
MKTLKEIRTQRRTAEQPELEERSGGKNSSP